jgi:hypothetical protein
VFSPVYGTLLVLFVALLSACDFSPTQFDESFSNRIFDPPPTVNGRPIQEVAVDSVDAVQIYRAQNPSAYFRNVAEVRRLPWIYETHNRNEIQQILGAIRQQVQPNACGSVRAKSVYVVLFFDHTFARVALVKYYPCDGTESGALEPFGGSGLRFSSAAARFIERDRHWSDRASNP